MAHGLIMQLLEIVSIIIQNRKKVECGALLGLKNCQRYPQISEGLSTTGLSELHRLKVLLKNIGMMAARVLSQKNEMS